MRIWISAFQAPCIKVVCHLSAVKLEWFCLLLLYKACGQKILFWSDNLSKLLFAFRCVSCYTGKKVWRLLKCRCISLHIMIKHEVPGYIMKDAEDCGNSFDLSWCIWLSLQTVGPKSGLSRRKRDGWHVCFRVSWRIMICHDLHHNISERYMITVGKRDKPIFIELQSSLIAWL